MNNLLIHCFLYPIVVSAVILFLVVGGNKT